MKEQRRFMKNGRSVSTRSAERKMTAAGKYLRTVRLFQMREKILRSAERTETDLDLTSLAGGGEDIRHCEAPVRRHAGGNLGGHRGSRYGKTGRSA